MTGETKKDNSGKDDVRLPKNAKPIHYRLFFAQMLFSSSKRACTCMRTSPWHMSHIVSCIRLCCSGGLANSRIRSLGNRVFILASFLRMVILPDLANLTFQGFVEITLEVVEPTATLTMHSLVRVRLKFFLFC
jgi:hypothetical protein